MQPQSAPSTPAGSADEATLLRMQIMLERAPLAVAFVRGERFEAVSEEMNHLFGHGDHSDLVGQKTRVVHVSDGAHSAALERIQSAFSKGRPLDDEVEYVRGNGERFWGRLKASPLQWNAPGGEAMWIVEDVTAARQLRMQPSWVGKHDALTELANRSEFERRLGEHVNTRRHEPVSVLWLDVDKFRDVINEAGAEVAEHFLYHLSQMLITKVRASDIVARVENDRFAMLLPNCDQHYAQIIAEKIRAAVASFRLRWGLHRTRVKACLGVVQLHPSLENVDAVLGASAQACAEAKAAGGDTVRVFVSTAVMED